MESAYPAFHLREVPLRLSVHLPSSSHPPPSSSRIPRLLRHTAYLHSRRVARVAHQLTTSPPSGPHAVNLTSHTPRHRSPSLISTRAVAFGRLVYPRLEYSLSPPSLPPFLPPFLPPAVLRAVTMYASFIMNLVLYCATYCLFTVPKFYQLHVIF